MIHIKLFGQQVLNNFGGIKNELKDVNIEINNIPNVKILPYIYNMEEIMNVSDLIVARSGAMTITEISVVAKPAIFIPLPNVSENHQEYNARLLEKIGGAKIILNNELNGDILNTNIKEIVEDKEKVIQMGKNSNKVAMQNVTQNIYNEIKDTINQKNKK